MQTAPIVGVPPAASAAKTSPERPIHADYRQALWATARDPMFLLTIVGLAVFVVAGSVVYSNLEFEQAFDQEIEDAPLGAWGFTWFLSAIFTPWRMHQASRLVPQMVGRGFSLRDPSLGSGRTLTWRPLVAVSVAMFVLASASGWVVNVTWGRDDIHRWFEQHPTALLASMCLISGLAYLVARVLVGTVLMMSIWKVHGIMARHKRRVLDATTGRIADLLAAIDTTKERHDTDYLELLALDVRYQTEAREYMVWPFGYLKFLAAAGVGAAAGPLFGFIWQRISKS